MTTITEDQVAQIAEALSAWQATWLARNPDLSHMNEEEFRRARRQAYEKGLPALELLTELHSQCFRGKA
jgi:hypothetical protein